MTETPAGAGVEIGPDGMLLARATHLEMLAPPPARVPMPLGHALAVLRVKEMPLAFYRYLYAEVGKASHWEKHRNLDDRALSAIVHDESVEIRVLYVDGAPAGFFELDLARLPAEAEIRYFGLTPDFQGRGLARFFLSEAVFAAFAHAPDRLTIQTCTLDNPRALQLYQRIGFSPYAWSQEWVTPWL
ncbi:MAG: GNAT family N-acetyltransferase [Aquamicrobium sp.]|uniref:GNAT family N-acetyltransferase n=1 Tax=Aquamicrobium sp. TaxID=1872579 RepID=UPI00349EA524|nr:GNAT family N-acetyltransferase [Aquamicrobium sp.]MCO5158147.1 GNAT family N-acetyltransferase [Aquamicrobium sp.]